MAKKHGNNTVELLPQDDNGITGGLATKEITITENGEYVAREENVAGYSVVHVETPETPQLKGSPHIEGTLIRTLLDKNGAFLNGCIVSDRYGNSWTYNLPYQLRDGGAYAERKDVMNYWVYDKVDRAGGKYVNAFKVTMTSRVLQPIGQNYLSAYTNKAVEKTEGYYSVAGLGSQNSSDVTYTYDDNFVITFEEVADNLGNVFIKIPTVYRKVLASADGQITSFAMSNTKLDDDYEPYPCFIDRTNNNAVLPYILVGKYQPFYTTHTQDQIKSQPHDSDEYYGRNEQPQDYYDLDVARNLAHNLGTGYQLYDWQINKLLADLGLIISRYFNGGYYHKIDIMGIEDWGSTSIDGIATYNTNDSSPYYYVCYDERNYHQVTEETSASQLQEWGYVALGYRMTKRNNSYGFRAKKLGYDVDNPFANFPAYDSDTVDTNFGGYYSATVYGAGSQVTNHWGRPAHDMRNSRQSSQNDYCENPSWYSYTMEWHNVDSTYPRLCYRPIKNSTAVITPVNK